MCGLGVAGQLSRSDDLSVMSVQGVAALHDRETIYLYTPVVSRTRRPILMQVSQEKANSMDKCNLIRCHSSNRRMLGAGAGNNARAKIRSALRVWVRLRL